MINTKLLFNIGIAGLLSTSSTLSFSEPDNSDWSTYQGNANHNGYINTQLDMNKIELVWNKDLGNGIKPVIANQGHAYVTTKDTVYKLTTKKGDIVWSTKLPNLYSMGAATIDNQNLYVQTVDESGHGFLRSYALDTGELNYKQIFTTQWAEYYAPTLYSDGLYTACGYTNAICAYKSTTGELLWSQNLSFFNNWTPTVTEKYVITLSDVLNVYDRNSGDLVFKYGKPYNVSSVWEQNGAAILGEMDDTIFTHSDEPSHSGSKDVLRSVSLTSQDLNWENKKEYQGQPVVGGKIVYAALANGDIEAYSELTGDLLWTWKNESSTANINNLVLTNNVLLLSTKTESFAIDIDSHKTVWTYPKGGQLAYNKGMIYIGSDDNNLYAFKVDATNINPSIDVMTTSTTFGYIEHYQVNGGIDVIGSAKSYLLSDGSEWDSGAGSHPIKTIKFAYVRKDLDGNYHYFFKTPEDGVIFTNTDYNSGEHSAQGTLSAVGTLEIIASPGKSTATMIGFTQITDNTPTYYDNFYYYSAKVGAIVPFKVVYEIENGVWDKSTFDHDFSYHMNGEIHFKTKDASNLINQKRKLYSFSK